MAGETSLALVDGANGRLLYRGYPIGELVRAGTYSQVAELLWTGEWPESAHLPTGPLSDAVLTALRALPRTAKPMDALRTAVSVWGATEGVTYPPTPEQARAITAMSPSALAAFGRLRRGKEPVDPDPNLELAAGFLYQLMGETPDPAAARALDAYFVVGAEHGFNASTFTARVIISTQSDLASAVAGAIGALKGPLHGGAPSEVVDQLNKIGSVEQAEKWLDDALDRGERLMGFGHRVYRAYDPRAAALRQVAEGMSSMAEWLSLAVAVEDIASAQARRASPGAAAQDERRVLRGRRPPGRGPATGPVPGHVRPGSSRWMDGARARAGIRQPFDPARRALRRPCRATATRSRGGPLTSPEGRL